MVPGRIPVATEISPVFPGFPPGKRNRPGVEVMSLDAPAAGSASGRIGSGDRQHERRARRAVVPAGVLGDRLQRVLAGVSFDVVSTNTPTRRYPLATSTAFGPGLLYTSTEGPPRWSGR